MPREKKIRKSTIKILDFKQNSHIGCNNWTFLSTECVDGFYGDGCKKTCGHCTDMTQCHHVTGTCLGGCKQGYKGDNCMQGTDKFIWRRSKF